MTTTINASTSGAGGLITTADNSGILALQSGGVTKQTIDSTGSYGHLILGTAQATTSGTSIDFTGIPSWAKRITVMFNAVSSNGTSPKLIQLGTSGGLVTTNYNGASGYIGATAGFANFTNGVGINSTGAANIMFGSVVLTLQNILDNTWTAFGAFGLSDAAYGLITGSAVTLSGALSRIRLTTVNGTDAFDLGSVNIMYEG